MVDIMKNKKNKLFIVLSVLIIGFLISTSSLNVISTKALDEKKHDHYTTDSFDYSTWEWTTTEVLSTESTNPSQQPSLAVDTTGNIHVAWWDETDYAGAGTDHDIFYKRWDVTNALWTITEVVSTESTSDSDAPSLAVDTLGNVHIAWDDTTDYAGSGTDRDIFYKRWDVTNALWTITEVVSTESTANSSWPSLAVDTLGNVHIVWWEYTNYGGSGTDRDIFYKHWDAATTSWTTTEVVSTESTGHSRVPSLAVDTLGNVHIAWRDYTNYNGAGTDADIFYKRWNASTSSWSITEVVSTESYSYSWQASLAADSTANVHIVWWDDTDYGGSGTDADIFYKHWNASTSTWTTTEVVSTESTGPSFYPSLAMDTLGNIHVAWCDETDYNGAGTDRDTFYKRWDVATTSWTTTEVVSTEGVANSYHLSLAVDTLGNVRVVWCDETDYSGAGTDADIFYKALTSIPPPLAPELAFIVPNPTDIDTVNLDWKNVQWANAYYVYRSTTYIYSVEGLIPISTVSSSDYIDTVPSEGVYYYVVVAGNLVGNSSHSNCQYVEVIFSDLEAPELAPILPNPTDSDSISLVWDSIDGAVEYYVYRSVSYIWSVESLTPITTVLSNSYVDSLPSENYYFYVIVANDGVRNSTHSNCEYVEYKVPHLREFGIISSLVISAFVVSLIIIRKRKNKLK